MPDPRIFAKFARDIAGWYGDVGRTAERKVLNEAQQWGREAGRFGSVDNGSELGFLSGALKADLGSVSPSELMHPGGASYPNTGYWDDPLKSGFTTFSEHVNEGLIPGFDMHSHPPLDPSRGAATYPTQTETKRAIGRGVAGPLAPSLPDASVWLRHFDPNRGGVTPRPEIRQTAYIHGSQPHSLLAHGTPEFDPNLSPADMYDTFVKLGNERSMRALLDKVRNSPSAAGVTHEYGATTPELWAALHTNRLAKAGVPMTFEDRAPFGKGLLMDAMSDFYKTSDRHGEGFEQGGPVDTPTEGEGGMYGAPDSMFNTPESLAAALYPQHNTAYADGGPIEMSGGGSELIKRAAGFLRSSRLGDMMNEITNRHGASQGRRFEQASDSANLDRYSDDALRQTFGRSDTGLYTTMPPGRFEDFAAPIPDRIIRERPYYKWGYHDDADMLSPNQQSYDEYMRVLKAASEYGGGLDQVPYLKLNKGLPFNDVVSHEGRHRMRMFDEEGDKNSLVQLLPTGGYGLFDDRVERLMKSYFLHGKDTPYMPEKSDVYDAFRPMVQFPNPVFAEGGPIEMSTGGHYDAPESEGAGYFRNNDYENYAGPENWLKKLGAPTIQRPGKVQDVHNWATKVGGADQGRRVEQAADLTNLGHFSSNALHETFAPGNSSLLMALPPSVFEHFSARLPDEYMARTPYGRWKNNVPGQERIPDSQKTMDAYLAQLRDHMDRGGANEVPAMWLAPPRPLHGEVVDHQGRHRARALAQAGDENMLLQIRPSNDGDMRGSLAERLARLTDKYFPSGAATRFEPQMDWKRRTPLSFPFAPFAEGGEVHMALGGTPPNTGGQYDAPEPEGGGYLRNNVPDMYAGPPELVKEGTRTVLARQHMRDTPRGRAAPPDPRIQTVRDPERMVYPGIYKDPNVIAEEASRRLMRDQGKDGPMSLLFGHTRASLDELSQGRDLEGMRPWPLRQAYTPPGGSTGSAVSEQVLTRRNANRLLDIHGEAMKYPGLRETRSWYEMLPLYQRMDELGVPIDEQRLFNQRTGIFSAAASPVSEINRGTLAHHLAQQGRIEDFVKYGGVAAKNRPSLLGFPDDLLDMKSHAYHGTAQAPTLAEIEMSGGYYPKEHKVGTYVAATDPVFPNYTRPVADSHIARGVGYSDVRPGKLANVKANLSNPEYTDFAPWWENSIAGNTGLRSRDQQALLWNVLGPQTGVRYIGPSKLELMSNQMMKASKRLGVSPEVARDMVLRGEAGAYKEGGTVEDQYHPIWQQSFQSGGQPKSDTRDWKLARPDTSRTLPESATRGWHRAEPDTSRTLSEPDTRDLLFRTQRFAGGGQPDTLPVQWDQDYDYENDPRDRSTVSGNLADALYGGRITPTPEERRAFREERAARRAEHPEGVYSTDPVRAVLGLLQKQRAGWQADQAEMYPGESSPWQRAGDQLGHMGRTLAHDVTGGLSDKLIAALSPGDYSANVPREEAATRSSRDQLDPYVRGPLSVLPFALSPAQQIKQYAMTVGSNLAEPAHGAIDWARKQFDKSMLGMVRPTAEGVSGALSPAFTRPMWDKGYGHAHGGSVEDQYHPIWSQNFKDGGGVHDILGTLGGLAGNLIPIPVLGPMLGKFAGHTLGNLIEGGSDEIGDDAARDFSFGMADPDAQGWAFGGPIGPTPPTDDFTSGAEEPGMPSFGPGIPGFDVDMLPVNPQIARDAAERRRLLGQVQADSQKGLAEQMKASSSGGGGGGGMGGILSSLAPFASMIPGVGPMAGMGMSMAGKMMAADGGPVSHYADGGSIPAPNGEQPWMYGGGALMARGGYLRGHGGMNG